MIKSKNDKLHFQNKFAFFNSMNWKATIKNFTIDNPIIKATNIFEIAYTFEITAVKPVSNIKNR